MGTSLNQLVPAREFIGTSRQILSGEEDNFRTALTDFGRPTYSFSMNIVVNNPVVIEELPYDPELDRLFEQAHRNLMWFNEHAKELGVFKLYRGRYVAAAGGELFVAETPEEVERLAREKYPDELPHVRYIPREKLYRIYAC